MNLASPSDFIRRRFLETHGAGIGTGYARLLDVSREGIAHAALGYRRAGDEALFLERYLDAPVEDCLTSLLGKEVHRTQVIEIGNLAADDPFAMVSLWGRAANDLGADCEIAVATLTAPLRAMFRKMGVVLHTLAPATRERADKPSAWGRYYEADPIVCAGSITQGQQAITAFLARRRSAAA